ncbi:F-box/kelch-repeat protein At1g57790-like [Silene latifolia]|uniref:F-box/kelch-repeat protein At1g57790-like n=1 Tax=Silene latifolia TaxID=37657 RepID=UPI003D78A31B
MASDFSMLPLDLLGVIALKIENFEDYIKFSVVCRSWNSASSSVKHQWTAKPIVPWLLLAENNQDNPDCVRKIYNLSNNKCYNLNLPETFGARCWGSSYGWVAMIDRNLDVKLFNPITKAQIPLPSLKPPRTYFNPRSGESYQNWFLDSSADKVIVLKVPQNDHYEFVVMLVRQHCHSVAIARHGDQLWTPVSVKSKGRMLDVVEIDDNILALYNDGSIVCLNVKEFNALEPLKPVDYSPCGHELFVKFNRGHVYHTYLVRSGSDLLAVLRYREQVGNEKDDDDIFCQTIDFEVYRFRTVDKSWEEIDDLGEVALVVGRNSSMCFSVGHTNGLQRNCIYFTDDYHLFWGSVREPGGHDTGVFDFESGDIWPFYEGDDIHSIFSPPTLFIPQF